MEGLGLSDLLNYRFYGAISNSIVKIKINKTNLQGELLRISFISGDIIEGLLFSIDQIKNEFFIITNPRRLSRTNKPIFLKENYLKIYFNEISFIQSDYKSFKPLAKGNFETDFDISKKKKPKLEKKNLIHYKINEGDVLYQGNLEDDNNEKWDQFEINKKKYNVKTTYDENNYTTTLDKKNISNEQKNKAEKIIKEIMRDSNKDTNIHVLEDRGLIEENDLDEEDKYSSVIRNKNNDKNDK